MPRPGDHGRGPSPARRASLVVLLAFSLLAFGLALAWVSRLDVVLPLMGHRTLAAADSLLEGRGLMLPSGQVFARRAPLHPVFLAGLQALGLGPGHALRVLSSLIFALSFLGWMALARTLRLRWPAALALLALGFAPSYFFLRINTAEALAIAASLFAINALAVYMGGGPRLQLLVCLAACAVASAGHYIAIFTLLPLVGLALAVGPALQARRRLGDLLSFLGIACLPIGLWLLRNWKLTGFLSGMSRSEARGELGEHSWLFHLGGLVKTAYWDLFACRGFGLPEVVYDGAEVPRGALAPLAAVLVMAPLGLALWRTRGAVRDYLTSEVRARSAAGHAWILSAGYVAWYSAVLLFLWTFGNNDRIQTRYVAPVYPFLLLALFLVPTALRRARGRAWELWAALLAVLTLAVVQTSKSLAVMRPEPAATLIREVWREGRRDRGQPTKTREERGESGERSTIRE